MNRILAIAFAAATLAPASAVAGNEILVRQNVSSFDHCVAVQDAMMRNLGADPDMLSVEMHTGAVLRRKYASIAADLVLVCNRVTDVIEVRRITPGTGGQTASAM